MTPRPAGLGALLPALVAVLAACAPPVARSEVTRLTGPDGRLDAVVETTDAGATTAPGFFVHVLPRGDAPARDRQLLRVVGPCCDASGRYGLQVRWTGPHALTVAYREARFADPATPLITAPVGEDGAGPTVEVRVRPALAGN